MGRTIIRGVLIFVVSLVLAACATSSTQGPMVWVDQPLDGARLPLEAQEVTAHGSDADGVASLEFYVDGMLLGRAPTGGGVLEHATVGWNPSRPAVYTISVTATDSQGNLGPETTSVVTVGELEAPPPPTPSAEPASSATELAATPVPPTTTPIAPTNTPLPPTTTPIPPTSTPPPPSPTTPPPPSIVSFQADPAQVQEGECTTVSWRVEGDPSEIYFDGEGVTSPDSRKRCPSETTSYTLVAKGQGGEVSKSLTVSVISDTDGPSIDNVQQSSNSVYCLEDPGEIVISARVRDPSGVSVVDLHCTLDEGSEEWCGAFSRSGNKWSVTYIPLEHAICSGTMEYRIRATDDSARGNVTWWGTGTFYISEY
jgi:hypothetical protein